MHNNVLMQAAMDNSFTEFVRSFHSLEASLFISTANT